MSSAMTSTKPAMSHSSHSSTFPPYGALSDGALRRNHLRVDAGPAEPAEEAAVLDLHAAVLDHFQPRVFGLAARVGVLHAQLHPQHLRTDRDRVIGQPGNLAAPAEAIDDIDGFRDVAQRLVTLFAQDLGIARIHRNHAISMLLE